MAEKKGKLAEIKTKPNEASVSDFLATVTSEQKRQDSQVLIEMMQAATGAPPKMWGPSIVGFGKERIRSERTGRELDWLVMGLSPRKASLSLYLSMNIHAHAAVLARLGKHKTGVGCLYINKLADVDLDVLRELIEKSLERKA